MKRLYACRNCKRFTTEKVCPYCGSTDLSTSWKGLAIILDAESEIAKEIGAKEPGKYALFVG